MTGIFLMNQQKFKSIQPKKLKPKKIELFVWGNDKYNPHGEKTSFSSHIRFKIKTPNAFELLCGYNNCYNFQTEMGIKKGAIFMWFSE